MGVQHMMLTDAAFTVLAQLCNSKARKTEMGDAIYIKTAREGMFTFKHLPLTNIFRCLVKNNSVS